MPQYMFLYRGGAPQKADISPEQMQQHLDKWWAWIEKWVAEGVLDPGKALETQGMVVSAGGLIADGPFTESKEVVGGYSVVTTSTIEAAAEVAKGCPIFEYDGQVEVRPLSDVCWDPDQVPPEERGPSSGG